MSPAPAPWQGVFSVPPLRRHEIHVWLDRLEESPPWSEDALPPDDVARADRLLAPARRAAFERGRRLLRFAVGPVVGCAPEAVPLRLLATGKPVIADAEPGLGVSITHTGSWVLVAVSRAGDVGVDLEEGRPDIDDVAIARRFYATEERTALSGLPEGARRAAFLRIWTRREAISKAAGDGLQSPFHEIAVPAHPLGESAGSGVPPVRIPAAWGHPGEWSLHDLRTPSRTIGALAVRHPTPIVVRMRWGG